MRRVEPVERAADRHQLGRSASKACQIVQVGQLGMLVRLGVGDASVEQPGVQLVIARHPQPRREEALAHQPDLVLDLPLLPARRRRAGGRLDQVMAAHPQKAAVELAVLADEHGLDRRLHVVVDAARAGPLEEGEGAVVRVEHHLLGLARIGPHEQHAAVAQPDMRHLDGDRRAVDQHDLVRPVELVGLARRKAQRHIGFRRRRAALGTPPLGVAANRVVAALITERRVAPRISGSASAARAPACPRSPAADRRADRATDQSAAAAAGRAHSETRSPRDRITLRTTFRDTRNSRQIALIGFFWAKYARRIFAIVSTTSIPNPAPMSPMEATVDPPSRGSRLDADHPENGVLIPCRFTGARGGDSGSLHPGRVDPLGRRAGPGDGDDRNRPRARSAGCAPRSTTRSLPFSTGRWKASGPICGSMRLT